MIRYRFAAMDCKFIWMNGTMTPANEAMVPFLTSGFHYGIGVFEGIRAYATSRGPAVFRLRDHLKRMELSCKILGFRQLPYSLEELAEATRQTIRANGFDECYIRPLVWLADGGWNLTMDTGSPTSASRCGGRASTSTMTHARKACAPTSRASRVIIPPRS